MKATRSSFNFVYLILLLVLGGVLIGFMTLSRLYVAPRLVENRAESIFAIIRSHENSILLSKTRDLRNELIASTVIFNDRGFQQFTADEASNLSSDMAGCQFITPSICLNDSSAIFFQGNSSGRPKDSFKYAVKLEAKLTEPPAILYLIELSISAIFGIAFFLLYRTISKQERYLLGRLDAAKKALAEVKDMFAGGAGDEFDSLSRSTSELVDEYKTARDTIAAYKENFERRTRLEQLGITVGQVSHDLKAPLNEAANFLEALPMLMESASKEDLEIAIDSLKARLTHGQKRLKEALDLTKKVQIPKERLPLADLIAKAETHSKGRYSFTNVSANSMGGVILANVAMLETVFTNLMDNSSDERSDASISILAGPGRPGFAKVVYSDNGGGIPEDRLEQIFEPLVSFKSKGYGLGLSSSRDIIRQHGGTIKAVPNPNGARFEIELPLEEGSAHA